MSRIDVSYTRTTNVQTGDQVRSSLRRAQRDLAMLQHQLSTGHRLERPSDEPARTSTVLLLQRTIEAREQRQRNLEHALGVLNNADQGLADTSDILLEAKSIASSQIGVGSDRDTRTAEASVIDAQIRALLDIANRQSQGVSLFGGNWGAAANQPVFVEFMGGIRYQGARVNLEGDLGPDRTLDINTNGDWAFGALSNRVQGSADLDPQATADTRLADVRGAAGLGVRLGAVRLTVDGTVLSVDLAGAQTLGDVAARLGDAIEGVDPAAGRIGIAGPGFELGAAIGHAIAIEDVGTSQTAADLGLVLGAADGAVAAGADLDPRLTARTALADLGTAVAFRGGLSITQGSTTRVADFASARTIEDLANVVDQLGLGVRLEINEAGTGLNLVSEVSGLAMSIGENAGGTTASDLGLRTFGTQTRLDEFRFGLGVEDAEGEADFEVLLHDGRRFAVDIGGRHTAGGVLDAIGAAATAAGLSVGTPGTAGTDFNVGLATSGNGFQLEDQTTGAADFRIAQLGRSLAATHLGLYANAGSAGQIRGEDQAMVRAESIFTHLIDLRDALRNNDSAGITLAGQAIEADIETTTQARAVVGTQARWIEDQQERSQEMRIAEDSLLSGMRDTEYTDAVSRFVQLQQQLEAALRVGSRALQNTLLDFLR